jgi:hypothetical protein
VPDLILFILTPMYVIRPTARITPVLEKSWHIFDLHGGIFYLGNSSSRLTILCLLSSATILFEQI